MKKIFSARTGMSNSCRSSTNLLGIGIILLLITPGMVGAADMIATAPVPSEQVRRSDDLGQSSTATEPQIETYKELLSAIRGVRAESQARVEKAVAQERVREAWETGKLINDYVLQNKERAEYGKQVLVRLAKDLGTSRSELSRMLQFYRAYPIFASTQKLSWGHFRELLSINDAEERNTLAEQAALNQWTQKEIRRAVRKAKGTAQDTPTKLQAIEPGPLNTYQIVSLQDSPKVDIGFGFYRDLNAARTVRSSADSTWDIGHKYPEKDAQKFKAGDIVTSVKDAKGNYTLKIPSPNPLPEGEDKGEGDQSQLYTYRALVTSVVDGDTFHALIDLGFGTTLAQRVRLRRVNAPEIVSADGKKAKAYLEKILFRDQGRIILQSSKLDQYGRPIADVWVLQDEMSKSSQQVLGGVTDKPKLISVDQELVDSGYAVSIEA